MKILITGANGFVGRHLVPKLLKEEHELLQITTDLRKANKLFGEKTKKFLYSPEKQNELISELENFQPEVCIHLAAFLTANDDFDALHKLLNANIEFTCNVLDSLKNIHLTAFINTGTFAEYYKGDGQLDPAYLYAATKSASRIFVDYYSKAYQFKHFTIAPYTIYGGIDTQKKIIDIIYDSLDSRTPINLTPGNQVLDFIHIDDVADFYVTALDHIDKIPDGISFQLGTGIGYTLKELVSIFEKKTGMRANINWGGRSYRPRDVMFALANISKQYHLFNWTPGISLEKGIEIYLNKKKSHEIKR